jgi:hypothetical protein
MFHAYLQVMNMTPSTQVSPWRKDLLWKLTTAQIIEIRLLWTAEFYYSSTERRQMIPAFACCLLHAGFLIDSLLNPEDEGNILLRNVDHF